MGESLHAGDGRTSLMCAFGVGIIIRSGQAMRRPTDQPPLRGSIPFDFDADRVGAVNEPRNLHHRSNNDDPAGLRTRRTRRTVHLHVANKKRRDFAPTT